MIAPYNHQSVQAEYGIKSLSNILTKYLTNLGQMWQKYLSLATFAYNTFNNPNIGNYSLYKLVFGRKPKLLLNLEMMSDVKVSSTFKDYYELLKRLQYLHRLLQDFKSKRLAMINIDKTFSNIIAEIHNFITHKSIATASRKVMIKYVGPVVIYKIIDPYDYLLMTLDGNILRGLFEHERLKPANVRTSQGNVQISHNWNKF